MILVLAVHERCTHSTKALYSQYMAHVLLPTVDIVYLYWLISSPKRVALVEPVILTLTVSPM